MATALLTALRNYQTQWHDQVELFNMIRDLARNRSRVFHSPPVQRALRDDHCVVRRDGTDGELTVDPTPFTVVTATNPRHPAGSRLLIVHENACVDAFVEPWELAMTNVRG